MASIRFVSDGALRGPCPILYAAETLGVMPVPKRSFIIAMRSKPQVVCVANHRWFQADRPVQRAFLVWVKKGRIYVQGWLNEKADHPAYAVTLRPAGC